MMGTRKKKDRRKDKALRARRLEPNGSPIAQSPLSDTALAQLVVLLNRMAVDVGTAYLEANPDTEWAVVGCHAFPTDVRCLTAVGFIGVCFEDRESGGSYLPLPWVVTAEELTSVEGIIKAIDPRLVEGFRADVHRAVATADPIEALIRLSEDPLRYLTGNAPSAPQPGWQQTDNPAYVPLLERDTLGLSDGHYITLVPCPEHLDAQVRDDARRLTEEGGA